MKSKFPLAGAIALVAGLAVWVTPGALVATDTSRRAGLLPSGWMLLVAVAVLAVAVAAASRRASLAPLLALGVLLLPWLPFRVPAAFLIWTGPVTLFVWAGVLAALVAVNRAAPAVPAAAPRHGVAAVLHRWASDRRRAPLVAIAIGFLLYLGASRQLSGLLPMGDSPHYLVITQSLLQDGDLEIENNHRQRDYLAYVHQDIRPHYLRRGKNGQIYSIHSPGLPVLVAPAFALGGYPGVVGFLAFLAALGGSLVWRLGYRITGHAGAAWFAWAGVALSAPFFFHAFTVFPDGPGATIVLAGAAALVGFEPRRPAVKPDEDGAEPAIGGPGRWALIGGALGALPWLHTRFTVAAAALGVCLVLRLAGRRAWTQLAAFAAVPLVSAIGWFGYFYALYGQFDPSIAYGANPSRLANIPGGFPALLLDQQFGVIPNAPIYAVAIVGLVQLFRSRPRLAAELSLVAVSYLSVVAAFDMWWGGTSSPGRFTVPVLLLFGIPAATFWSGARSAGRAAGAVALTSSLMITAVLTLGNEGGLVFNSRDGFARWLDWVSPVVDLPRGLPAFLRDPAPTAILQSLIWATVILAGVRLLVHLQQRLSPGSSSGRSGIFALATIAVFIVSVMGAVSLTWWTAGVVAVTPTSAAMNLLRKFDPARLPVGVQFRPARLAAPEALTTKMVVETSSRGRQAPGAPLLFLAGVPPGVYRLRPVRGGAVAGTIAAVISRSTRPLEQWQLGPGGSGQELVLRLPVTANGVTITGDGTAVQTLQALALQPLDVLPATAPMSRQHARAGVRYGETGVFVVGDGVFLETAGLWVEGAKTVPLGLQVAPAAGTVKLLARNGPVANVVNFAAGSWRLALSLQPSEERVVEVPVDAGGRALLDVRAERGFRPSETEPGSKDQRLLGVWLQF